MKDWFIDYLPETSVVGLYIASVTFVKRTNVTQITNLLQEMQNLTEQVSQSYMNAACSCYFLKFNLCKYFQMYFTF